MGGVRCGEGSAVKALVQVRGLELWSLEPTDMSVSMAAHVWFQPWKGETRDP